MSSAISSSATKNKPQLFDESSSDDDEKETGVKINQKYAKAYQLRKERQELLTHRKTQSSDDDESSSEEEDEDAELLTTQIDVEVFKTINALRTKDDRIYDESVKFFEEEADDEDDSDDEEDDTVATAQKKPKRVKDVLREQVMEDMEKGEAMDEAPGSYRGFDDGKSRYAYDAEQESFRRELVQASGHDEDGDVVIPKMKDKKEAEKERLELLQEMEKLKNNKDEVHKLVDPKGEVTDGEGFLLDFFQNRPWKQHEESEDESEDEQVVPMKPPRSAADNDDDVSLEELDKTDEFEAKYNFRFEETVDSGATHSLRNYSRGNVDTLRRKDDRRREKRLAKQERKAAERKQKEEQLKRLKNAKRQEMEEKLGKIKSVVGKNDTLDEAAIMKLLEGEFDADKFEEIMKETYNNSFYEQEDEEWDGDRAVRDSLKEELGDEQVDDAEGDLYDAVQQEDGDEAEIGDSAELQGEEDNQEDWIAEDEEEAIADEEETGLDKKLRTKIEDELYKLDYEDIVAGMPTRFKYRQVEPNNYGLSTEEILFARDTTLKQFVSLKKLAPYTDQEYHVTARKRRKFRDMVKEDVEETKQLEQQDESKKKKSRRLRKGKRREGKKEDDEHQSGKEEDPDMESGPVSEPDPLVERKTDKGSNVAEADEKPSPIEQSIEKPDAVAKDDSKQAPSKKKRKRSRKAKVKGVSNARLDAYGL